MYRINWRLILILLVLNLGCGPAFIIQPTSKSVVPRDVLGSWQYYEAGTEETITVSFFSDGTFQQTILDAKASVITCPGGTWVLAGSDVELNEYMLSDGTSIETHWWMIDDPKAVRGFVLFGGHYADPDSFLPMERVTARAKKPVVQNAIEITPSSEIEAR